MNPPLESFHLKRNNFGSKFGISQQNQEYHDLYRFIVWLVGTSLPVTTMVILLGVFSGSLTLIATAIDAGLALLLNIVSLITLGVILRDNTFKYPYGTGKLENFIAFLYGVLIMPLAVIIINSALNRYLHPPETINLWTAQLFFIAVVRIAAFAVWITRLAKKYHEHSPLLTAYYVDYRASFIYATTILCTLAIGLILANRGGMRVAIIIDIGIAVLISLYLLYNGCRLIIKNFRSLIDLPLEEKFQYRIIKCLTEEFEAYEGIGTLFTRMSGTKRLVQIELQFDKDTTIKEIDRLRQRIEKRLREQDGKIVFHLIPRCLNTEN